MRLGHLVATLALLAGLGLTAYVAQHQAGYRDPVLATTVQVPPPVVEVPPARSGGDSRTRASVAPVDEHWVEDTAARAGIPVPAMRAYARATRQVPESCHLGWTTLAGIGWLESHHGTIGGRSVSADGHPSPPILGPALDGHGRFAAIPASAQSARWHGDATWDHAVGPMQFIPSTWSAWGADGDGDGVADPNDLDDAARAAARYLCASGSLASGAGWAAAVYSYNHEDVYVAGVFRAAETYAERTA
ncbi:lytic transglycosylase domain-containing protein [Nocardioides sp. LHG3406-4]|uniref:lytic transglycosylase domain-containing protein n=1 Tax=Nocardioides sp. LHG3406-4 TaxID=2804575 RepID=UPI003CF38BAE